MQRRAHKHQCADQNTGWSNEPRWRTQDGALHLWSIQTAGVQKAAGCGRALCIDLSAVMRQHRSAVSMPAAPFDREALSRIVVAVDATDAEPTARFAISLVHGRPARELTFCHVIDVMRMFARAAGCPNDYALLLTITKEEARAMLDRCCLLAREAGVFARACIRYGDRAAASCTFAERHRAGLIVIGNGRAHGDSRDGNRSVVEAQTRKASRFSSARYAKWLVSRRPLSHSCPETYNAVNPCAHFLPLNAIFVLSK